MHAKTLAVLLALAALAAFTSYALTEAFDRPSDRRRLPIELNVTVPVETTFGSAQSDGTVVPPPTIVATEPCNGSGVHGPARRVSHHEAGAACRRANAAASGGRHRRRQPRRQ